MVSHQLSHVCGRMASELENKNRNSIIVPFAIMMVYTFIQEHHYAITLQYEDPLDIQTPTMALRSSLLKDIALS